MSRSSKKGPFVSPTVVKKVRKVNQDGKKKVIKTWARDCVIAPEFVGHTFGVHNGKEHISVFCTEAMVGHKFGEFSPTRKFRAHGGRDR